MLSQPGNASRVAESVLMYDSPAVARIVLSVPPQHIEYAPTPTAVRFRACQIAVAGRNSTTCVEARFGKDFQHLNIAEVAQRWPDHDVFFAHAEPSLDLPFKKTLWATQLFKPLAEGAVRYFDVG